MEPLEFWQFLLCFAVKLSSVIELRAILQVELASLLRVQVFHCKTLWAYCCNQSVCRIHLFVFLN